MKRRSYGQACALAKALDLVGERWTLLMVRELLIAPRRYRDLVENLPGMGTNLLADRLKEMERNGLVERVPLAEGKRNAAYQLTPRGRGLEPVLANLIAWGVPLLDDSEGGVSRPEWDFLAFRLLFRPVPGCDLDGWYTLTSESIALCVEVSKGRLELRDNVPADQRPVSEFSGRDETLRSVVLGRISAREALKSGELQIKRSRALGLRFLDQFVASSQS